MGKFKRSVVVFFCIILSGCSFTGRDINVDKTGIVEYYNGIEGMKLQVAITAEFPERVSRYRVSYAYAKDAAGAIEILEPKEVGGIKISIDQGETEIQFDGTRLETGTLDANGLTPLSALPKLIEQWKKGEVIEVERASRDGTDAALMVYSEDDGKIEYRTWFDRASYNPMYAEIIVDGKCVIRCEYETVSRL